MENRNDYGMLLTPNIKLHRKYFEEMVRLIGINCIFRAPKKGKRFDSHGDLDAKYEEGITVGCIFDEHPDQRTLKKKGWVTELQSSSCLISVAYDLKGLEEGALFIIPSGIDGAPGRMFRVIKMTTIMVYPASITCEVAPEYISTEEPVQITDFKNDNMPLLKDCEDDD